MLLHVGSTIWAITVWARSRPVWAPVALRGQVRAPRQSMRSRGTEGHRLAQHHLVVYTWMDPYGVRGSH